MCLFLVVWNTFTNLTNYLFSYLFFYFLSSFHELSNINIKVFTLLGGLKTLLKKNGLPFFQILGIYYMDESIDFIYLACEETILPKFKLVLNAMYITKINLKDHLKVWTGLYFTFLNIKRQWTYYYFIMMIRFQWYTQNKM